MPDWKAGFRSRFKPLFKENYDAFENALACVKPRHVRINSCRGIDYLKELSESSTLRPVPGLEDVFSADRDCDRITESISFQTGGAYIMNPSSLIPVKILASLLPETAAVLDVSAAPGGKTCALSDYMKRKGVIVANEVSASRLKALHFNLEKYGCYNVRTISADGAVLYKIFEGAFDGVLLDAPCSNENKIFRNKTVQTQWGPELIARMSALQRRLVRSAFSCLAPGGILVYSTCTLNTEENEDVISCLLREEADAELIKTPPYSGGGFSGISRIDEAVSRIIPDDNIYDGFFAAAVRKKGDPRPKPVPAVKKANKDHEIYFEKNYGRIPDGVVLDETNNRVYAETALKLSAQARYRRLGLNVFRRTGKTYEAAAQGLWEFGKYAPPETRIYIEREEALEYLNGFDLPERREISATSLFYGDLPVGIIKRAGGVLKNKLDRYFLYGKNIEWQVTRERP